MGLPLSSMPILISGKVPTLFSGIFHKEQEYRITAGKQFLQGLISIKLRNYI
jgi:hypothetical protein